MADVISKTINTQIRKKLSDGTYQLEHPETSIENVLGKAAKEEAEAGTDNTKYMTPLRVKEAISELGIKTSVFSGATASDSGYRDLIIPLGKIPEKYIKLEGQGLNNSMGVCLIDIAKNKAYIHEVYYLNDKMHGQRIEYDLGVSSRETVHFLGADEYSHNPDFYSIRVDNDKLILKYYISRYKAEVTNILVEVL